MHTIKLLFLLLCIHSCVYPNLSSAHRSLQEHLTHELNDVKIANELSTLLIEDILSWKAPTVEENQVNSIIAFSFGNRILPNGNHLPGPVNEALAEKVIQLHEETNAHVYAQWEIAEAIGSKITSDKMTIVYPQLDAQSNVVYLSTVGIVSEIIKQIDNPERLGTVAVIAFNDHLYRCITITRKAGINAFAPVSYTMPDEYDLLSGQPWTRDRLCYLLNDIKTRITNCL